ncbi:hypothetical protein ACG92U_03285 [Leuconostoc citreum]
MRNITFETPYDDFPQWDPTDERTGNWNSQYDAISVQGASNVWLDHNTFDDGRYHDSQNGTYFGREYQHHDGMTDITNGADNITISDSVYRNHDKTMLIGNSDSKTSDTGKLHVTLVRNLFQNTVQRTPRVRYGDVQVINNFYQNDGTSTYQFKYAWGLGKRRKLTPKIMYSSLLKNHQWPSLISLKALNYQITAQSLIQSLFRLRLLAIHHQLRAH